MMWDDVCKKCSEGQSCTVFVSVTLMPTCYIAT